MAICRAKRYGDQMICGRCGVQWDVEDTDLPKCMRAGDVVIRDVRAKIQRIKQYENSNSGNSRFKR